MAVDKATVARIAALARIEVPGVEPMASVAGMGLRRREDAVTDGGIRDKVLANAPETDDGFFVVPKVVE
jgi:aspartyl-tRNA(Asn)/glutamyl-tRNA(Gln) amidotransferase subunit C